MVASGEPVAKRPESPSLARHVWRQDRPYPSYLFGFAAARFMKATGTARRTKLHYSGIEDGPAALRRKFRDTGRMLAFFEDRSGLIAHEVAHQWWGNLLTCATWKDFWLNEGVTTFMVAAYKEERWGKAAYPREMELWRARHQKAIDAGFDLPLTFDGEYPSLGIKRAVVYSKGALFLDALREEIGENAFRSGLRSYTRACTGRSVESRDFQDAMERSAKRSLTGMFERWVYGDASDALHTDVEDRHRLPGQVHEGVSPRRLSLEIRGSPSGAEHPP